MTWIIRSLVGALYRLHPKAPDIFCWVLGFGGVAFIVAFIYEFIVLCDNFPIFIIK